MRFNANARKIIGAQNPDPSDLAKAMAEYNKRLGGRMSNGSCPGHFGQGTGRNCCVCGGRIQEIV